MRIVVTGAGGFLGRALVPRLVALGHDVIAAARRPMAVPLAPGITPVPHDLADRGALDALVDGADLLYHLAWSSIPATAEIDPVSDLTENVAGSLRLFEALARGGRRRVVFASSGGTLYGAGHVRPAREDDPIEPHGVYGVAKATVESYLDLLHRRAALDAVVVRLSNPFGPGQMRAGRLFGAVPHFLARAAAGHPIEIFGDGSVVRDFLHVDDAIDALLRVGLEPTPSMLYNVGSGVGRSLIEVARTAMAAVGRDVEIRHLPPRPFDARHSVLDITRASTELGWRPRIAFEVGVARLAAAHEREPAP